MIKMMVLTNLFFLEWTNNVKMKTDERVSYLTNKLHTNKHRGCLSSPSHALNNIHEDFVVVPIDKATSNIALVCKRFYASVITRELGLNNTVTHLQILKTTPVAYLQ